MRKDNILKKGYRIINKDEDFYLYDTLKCVADIKNETLEKLRKDKGFYNFYKKNKKCTGATFDYTYNRIYHDVLADITKCDISYIRNTKTEIESSFLTFETFCKLFFIQQFLMVLFDYEDIF